MTIARALSDHPSNPLQATSSDATNNAYNRIYHQAAKQRPIFLLSSEDELGQWPGQEDYQQQVQSVANPAQARFEQLSTPKHVDLDEDMSDDELAFNDTITTIDPRRAFAFHDIKTSDPFVVFKDEKVDQTLDYSGERIAGDQDSFDQEEHVAMDDLEDQDLEYQDDLGDYAIEDDEMSIKDERSSDSLKCSPLSPFSSPQSSRPPSPDESRTLFSRPADEQTEIQREMTTLNKAVPELQGQYQLLDRLGTGTFSSVYKAIDILYDQYDNRPWLGNHPPESTAHYQSVGPTYKGRGGRGPKRRSASTSGDLDVDMEAESNHVNPHLSKDENVYVAVKRIHTTSGPDRIKNELSILETCRGCRHASQIITAFRNYDQVVIVLPYQRNMDFRDFYQVLHPEGIKCYFRCLFRALRDIHARGIIHRDVKPANFLYDPHTGIGTLCDFGLASRMESNATISELGKCLHSAAAPIHPHGIYEVDEGQRAMIKTAQREARLKSNTPAERVGYPENDRRPVSKANRAGTRGFRAPEVLLKCQAQTGAIDVWSAGIILLCFLSGKFPIFQSNDDIEALMEIASVLGMKKTERAATLHGRTLATNVPDLQQQEGITWQEFVERLNPDITTPPKYDMRYYPHKCKHRDGIKPSSSMPPLAPSTSSPPPSTSDSPAMEPSNSTNTISDRYLNPPPLERHMKDMENAFDLLEAMLHFESIKRIIPREVLYHPFLSEPGIDPETEGDDEFVPHPPGMGACRELHRVDGALDEMYVEVWRKPEEVINLDVGGSEGSDVDLDEEEQEQEQEHVKLIERHGQSWVQDFVCCIPGQGIAIGNKPCEFHRDPRYRFK